MPDLFRYFDSLLSLGYSHATLFESATPGATSALISWAESNGHRWRQRTVTPPGVEAINITTVDVVMADGFQPGPHIVVQSTSKS